MESALNLPDEPPSRLQVARALLMPKVRQEPAWPALAAAGLFAIGGLTLAFAALTAAPAGFEPVPQVQEAP